MIFFFLELKFQDKPQYHCCGIFQQQHVEKKQQTNKLVLKMVVLLFFWYHARVTSIGKVHDLKKKKEKKKRQCKH